MSNAGPVSPWPGYPDIPIFLDTRPDRRVPRSQRSTVTTVDTSRTQSPVSPPERPHGITVTPPKSTGNTTLRIPSTDLGTSEESSHGQTDRSPVRHLSPVEYPNIQKTSESWTTRCSKTRVFRQGNPLISHFHLGGGPSPHKSGYTRIGTENPSGLGIVGGADNAPSNYEPSQTPTTKEEKSSLNVAQRIEDRLWHYSIHGNLFKRWLLEIISWSISAVCMGAIVGVLICLQDKPLDKWRLANAGITLNTFVATFSRIASAALLLPVSEALGQLKWSWFFEGSSKKMWDFEIFDNASRGPWGSLQLLVRTKGRKLAALGAAIVLFALALDPFFQQLLDFPERWTLLNETCTLPRVSRYDPIFEEVFMGGERIATQDTYLQAVANRFFYDNGTQPVSYANGTRSEFSIYCPTSNCTWPLYETLGVCSACADVSYLLDFTCLETEVDWISTLNGTGINGAAPVYPTATVCGYFLNATSDRPTLMSGYVVSPGLDFTGEALLTRALPLLTYPQKEPLYGNGSIRFKDHRNPIADFILVGAARGPDSVYHNVTPIALECVLSWCVKIQSSYSLARYTEEITATFINTTEGPFPWRTEPFVAPGINTTLVKYLQDITLDVSDQPQDPNTAPRNSSGFGVSKKVAFNTLSIFNDIFPSFVTVANVSADALMRYSVWRPGKPLTRFLPTNPWAWPNDVSSHMERLAKGLTEAMRASDSHEMIGGSAYEEETYISVRWQWLALPLGLLIFSLLFLVTTMLRTSKERDHVGVWKTSAIATLLYGLPDDMQKKITSSTSSNGTPRAKAKELKVKLHPQMGWRVSGNLFSPTTPKAKRYQPPPGWI